ncbi:MAG: SEC-C domain-containing protein [Gammaproteobacteria bacterium]|nr:SEC-C domain-containing protein [Gammaproteobacteria bacterium]MCP5137986.1 SEC-C domain-containing protein [Gammaproteobacteria bacterium]
MLTLTDLCPCESGLEYGHCCEPYLNRREEAPTAEALMRSRYVAYKLGNADYLRHSWDPATCPEDLSIDDDGRWLGLKIKHTEAGGVEDDTGTVEFVARYKVQGRGLRLHEISRFKRHHGNWVYVDGDLIEKAK